MGVKALRRAGWIGAAAALAWAGAWIGIRLIPLPAALLAPISTSGEFVDRNGVPLREVRVEARYARVVALADVPPRIIHAMLAAEDRRFYEHGGVDWLRTASAALDNLRNGRVRSGASTITQQLVKLSHPRRTRGWWTKAREAATAMRVEQAWSKPRILEAYLNRVNFGNLNIGIAAAAQYYFDKPLTDLTDAEAAYLAGLPKGPTRLNPHRAPGGARVRQAVVLQRMAANGWLDAPGLARALAEEPSLQPRRRAFRAGHFVDLLQRDPRTAGGKTIRTTLDWEIQRRVETVVQTRLAPLRAQRVQNAAVVVIENQSGDVLALVGSEDWFAPGAGMVNGAWAPRSAGSALKPFTYLLALEQGQTAATVVADVPTTFATATGVYRPQNYTQRCFGPVRYRVALGNSLNIPAVKVLSAAGGPVALHERLEQWGLSTLTRPAGDYGLGLTIGNCEVRLLELCNAYATLARLGRHLPYRLALDPRIDSPDPTRIPPAIDPRAAWLIADMLADNEARALSFGRESALRFPFPVACKTGTSTDFRDNWALGYTPEFTVGVWVGNFDGTPMQEVSGVTGAAPMLHDVFELLRARQPLTWYPRPADMVELPVHRITGHSATAARPDTVAEHFIPAHLPPPEAPADYDEAGRVKLGAEYQDWLSSAENGLAGRVASKTQAGALHLLTPVPGTTFLVDPDVPSSRRIPLEARGAGLLLWESATLQCRAASGRAFADATEGTHRLRVRDPATGEAVETWVIVKEL